MGQNENGFPLNVIYGPVKFDEETQDKDKYIADLIELRAKAAIKKRLDTQALHNLFIMANYLQNKINTCDKSASKEELTNLKDLHKLIKHMFNERIKYEKKMAIIDKDAKRYLASFPAEKPTPQQGWFAKLKHLLLEKLIGKDYLQLYEYHHKFNLMEIQKTILLKSFSTLTPTDQAIFISTLFLQSPAVIEKVICAQSLGDLDLLRKHAIPLHEANLKKLSAMIDDYEKTIKTSEPALKAQKYLNDNTHILKEIAGTPEKNYKGCEIKPFENNYSVHITNGDSTHIIEGIHERTIIHYAIESSKEKNIEDLKKVLFPKVVAG